jgi:hypothetical protein
MDQLVAQYARPQFEATANESEDLDELLQNPSALALNFSLPPIAAVSANPFCTSVAATDAQ